MLVRSAELEATLHEFAALRPLEDSPRSRASHILCNVALEHAESAKLLIVAGNFTSAVGLLRLQYEALVRAMWLLYAASDNTVEKLAGKLTDDRAKRADKMPMLSEMLAKLAGKAPEQAMGMLREFKLYSWKPLSSFIHGGIHAIDRHSKGYPVALLEQALKASNGVSVMVGMLLVILSGDARQRGKIPRVQMEFADCLPTHKENGS